MEGQWLCTGCGVYVPEGQRHNVMVETPTHAVSVVCHHGSDKCADMARYHMRMVDTSWKRDSSFRIT